MKRLSCLLVLILAMSVPSFCFGAEPQEKQGPGITKQLILQSVQQSKDQKKKEFQQLKDQKKKIRAVQAATRGQWKKGTSGIERKV